METIANPNFTSSKITFFSVVVDYGRSLEDMIRAGEYNSVDDFITEDNFPIRKDGTLFHFNRYINSDEVIEEMKKQGFRPAVIEELLAFGELHPWIQQEFPMVALGSVWVDPYSNHNVLYLWGNSKKRGLGIAWIDTGWDAGCRFLAIRQQAL